MKNKLRGNNDVKYTVDSYKHYLEQLGVLDASNPVQSDKFTDKYGKTHNFHAYEGERLGFEVLINLDDNLMSRDDFEDNYLNIYDLYDRLEKILVKYESSYYVSDYTTNVTDLDMDIVLLNSEKPTLRITVTKKYYQDEYEVVLFMGYERSVWYLEDIDSAIKWLEKII